MQKLLRSAWMEVLLALVLVLLNGWVVVRVIGVAYGPFDWAAYAGIYMGESTFPNGCSDGIDNDRNNLVDCADPDCRDDRACIAAAPVIGPAGLVLLFLVLLLVAAFAVRRGPGRETERHW